MVEFYGRLPSETMRAVVVTLDGAVVAIMGLALGRYASRLFSEFKPEFEPYLRTMTVLRAIKAGLRLLDEHAGRVYAVAQHDEGARLLTRLGFIEQGELYWRD